MVHHGDEQVEQHDDVDDCVGAEHEHAPEPREDLDPLQLERVQVHQSERRPEQRLHRLEQAATRIPPAITPYSHDRALLYRLSLKIYWPIGIIATSHVTRR